MSPAFASPRATLGVAAALTLVACTVAPARPRDAGTVSDGASNDFVWSTQSGGGCIPYASMRDGYCRCDDQTPTPCEQGCADLQNDDDNCGACGHACPAGAPCFGGQCSPTPVVVSQRPVPCGAIDLAVVGGNLYWTEQAGGEVMRVPVGGGAPTTFAAGEDNPVGLAVQGSTLYWMAGLPPNQNETAASLRSAPLSGGAATTLFAPHEGVGGFVVTADGQTIYVSTSTTVVSVSPSQPGAAPPVVASHEAFGVPLALAVDGTHLAFTTSPSTDGAIWSVVLTDGAVARCALQDAQGNLANVMCGRLGRQDTTGARSILSTGGRLLWPNGNVIESANFWPATAEQIDIGDGTFVGPVALVVRGDTLFYTDFDQWAMGSQGTIGQVAVAPDLRATRLARGQREPRSIAVDADHVYWSTADCAILSQVTQP